MKRIIVGLETLPRTVLIALSFGLFIGISILDYAVTSDLWLWPLYLIPIALMTWFVGGCMGGITALLSAAVVCLIQIQTDHAGLELFPSVWNGAILGAVGIFIADLLHNLKIASEIEKQLSRIDAVTGAVNRHFFLELLEAEFYRAERYRFPLTLAYIGLDNLKQLNDRLGYQATDEVLYQFVDQLSQSLRSNDVVARLGNDEFAVLLPQTNDNQAQTVFSRIQSQLKEILAGQSVPLVYHVAVVTALEMPDTLETLLEQSALLLKQSKNGADKVTYEILV
ncbi:MAG TPA: GGDEF domain-containing protein [Stenomitos sp.]